MLHKEQRRLGKSILQEKNFEVFSTFYFYREVWTPVSVPGDYVLNKLNLSEYWSFGKSFDIAGYLVFENIYKTPHSTCIVSKLFSLIWGSGPLS